MKKLSIKAKVTLWYTTLIVLLMSFVLIFIFASTKQVVMSRARANLEEVTIAMADEVGIDDEQIELDEDFRTYIKGVNLLLFKGDKLIAGEYPQNFSKNIPLQIGDAFTVNEGIEKWLFYDVIVHEDIFIRGIYHLNEISQSMNQIMIIAIIAFPFIAFIAAFGGYFITKKAFTPVVKIYEAASNIESGSDLTQRINLEDRGDEISNLAKTFDLMLDKLEKSFEKEKQFTSDVSHELRTPISVIKSQCEYALSQDNSDNAKEALSDILSQTDKMTLLVSQLLELSRGEHKMKHLQFENVNLSELLEIVVEELMEEAHKKSIFLTINASENIMVNCEQTLIMRLMINLITNAIKYTNQNGHVEASLEQNEKSVVLRVSDTGIGIGQEHIEKIFNRFYQVDPSRTKENQNSFGLGLAMCKWIVSLHHGTIEVQSEVGKGSSFIVTMPE